MFILFILINFTVLLGFNSFRTHANMDFAAKRARESCKTASWVVFSNLRRSSDPRISELMRGVKAGTGHTFLIPMGDGPFTHLSVSVPPDAMGNRGPPRDDSKVPECIETALVGPDGKLVYIDGLGYTTFLPRFYGRESYRDAIPELEAEILRLVPYARGEEDIPEESEEESEEEFDEGIGRDVPMDVDL